jgi:hypothetical protein
MDHYWLPGTPQSFDRHPWEGFAVVFGTNILGLFIVVFRRDVVWTVGATWINAAIFTRRPKTLAVNVRPASSPCSSRQALTHGRLRPSPSRC